MENHTSDYRVEKDSIGTKDVPANVYYGVQSLRAAENFPITGLRMNPELIRSLAYIKKAAALTNLEAGLLNARIANAIVRACDEILAGKLREQFIVDPMQGGAGTSINMNANEVIANRAIELLGGDKGDYSLVNPNDHVNCGQSTNDVIPTAGKMTTLRLAAEAGDRAGPAALPRLRTKPAEFDHVIKMGRTQMQDAVPIRLGQEFRGLRRRRAARHRAHGQGHGRDALAQHGRHGHRHRHQRGRNVPAAHRPRAERGIRHGAHAGGRPHRLHPEPGPVRGGVGRCQDLRRDALEDCQ